MEGAAEAFGVEFDFNFFSRVRHVRDPSLIRWRKFRVWFTEIQ
jgi:hypothetical protein